VFLDPDYHLYISSLDIRQLISFGIEVHYMFIRSARLNIYLQFLLLIKDLLAFALFANITSIYFLTFSSAVFARLLHVLVHART